MKKFFKPIDRHSKSSKCVNVEGREKTSTINIVKIFNSFSTYKERKDERNFRSVDVFTRLTDGKLNLINLRSVRSRPVDSGVRMPVRYVPLNLNPAVTTLIPSLYGVRKKDKKDKSAARSRRTREGN